ncbi:MAG TPA: Wzz/FepE/Etk N-terminal domain-containing protein [Blastocatellia bacterium]|nr:Wzz/FepE/Etk N-terminal domain-containing protein [Blastocatellia bacterium]
MNDTAQEEIRLDRLFAAIWRGRWLIITGTLLAVSVAAYLGFRQPTLHTASALIEIGRVWKEPLEDIYATAEATNSDGFIQKLATKIGVRPNQLKRSVKAEAVMAGPRRSRYPILVRVTATTDSGDESVRLAQAVADEIVARHADLFKAALAPHLTRKAKLEELQKQISNDSAPGPREMLMKVGTEIDDINSNITSPTLTEETHLVEPVVPGATIRPSPWRSIAFTALVAAVALTTLVALVNSFRPAAQRASSA